MGAFLWVVDGNVFGVGATEEQARERGITMLRDSTNIVLGVSPQSAPLFNLDAAVARGVSVEYAYVGGAWPYPMIDPTRLLLSALGAEPIPALAGMLPALILDAQQTVPQAQAPIVAAPAPDAPAMPAAPSAPPPPTTLVQDTSHPVEQGTLTENVPTTPVQTPWAALPSLPPLPAAATPVV